MNSKKMFQNFARNCTYLNESGAVESGNQRKFSDARKLSNTRKLSDARTQKSNNTNNFIVEQMLNQN